MKISMLSSFDSAGGAARSAYRLHHGLLREGIDSTFYTKFKTLDDVTVRGANSSWEKISASLSSRLDVLPVNLYKNRDRSRLFSPSWLSIKSLAEEASFQADVVHLHWVNMGFVSVEFLMQINRPIVWTLHDSWAFTGGCHVPYECKAYAKECGQCPQLHSHSPMDLSHRVWRRKRASWEDLDINFVTPSRWLAQCAEQSSLLKDKKIKVIPNGIDTTVFKPLDKKFSRSALGLKEDATVILFGAFGATSDRNKGFHFIQPALKKLAEKRNMKEITLLVFGGNIPDTPGGYGCEVRSFGKCHDDLTLALLYSAADVMIVPSIQENLPNTVIEAMACGTPVVAFRIGGIPDIVEHCVDGYLAAPFDVDDLALGLNELLQDAQKDKKLRIAARKKVLDRFDLAILTKDYKNLYEEIHATYKRS